MTVPYKLYGRQNSGSFAVQVALEEFSLPYERIWVGREPSEVAQFQKIHSIGKVPALILPDGTKMFESAAMLIHLAEAHAKPTLATTAHALFLQWMVFLSANVYEAALRMYYAERYSTEGEAHADGIRRKGAADFIDHLGLMSQALKPYVLGNEFSVADIYLYMLATWYVGEKAELFARLPALAAHATQVSRRPSIVKVEADHVT
jgi:glutathione S-transferase